MMRKREGKGRVAMGTGCDMMSSSHPQGNPELLIRKESGPCNPSRGGSDFISRQSWRLAAPTGPTSGRERVSQREPAAGGRGERGSRGGGSTGPGPHGISTELSHDLQLHPQPLSGGAMRKVGDLLPPRLPLGSLGMDGACWRHPMPWGEEDGL